MEYDYSTNKYYSSSENQYSSEDSSSYTTETKYRSCSPYLMEQCSRDRDGLQIPTRQNFITASRTTHNPLQFVSQQSAAAELREQARQQIEVSEKQKRILEATTKPMDDETSWQTNLDSWLSKRKSAATKKNDSSDHSEHLKQRMPLKTITDHRFKDKEEILTISSSSPLDEHTDHTDSGIENNRSNSNLQSPSTSLDFSPRSDSRQSGYLSGPHSPRYFIRASSPSPPGAAPLAPPPLPPNSEQVLKKSTELDDLPANVGTLLQIDTNKTRRSDKAANLDQVVIGFSIPKKSYGSDYSSAGGRTLYSDSENEFPPPPSNVTKEDLATKFGRATPLESRVESRVDSALPDRDYDSTLSESNSGTLENVERVSSPLSRTTAPSRGAANTVKGISLGVELQREQSANITAIKFPLKKQNYTTQQTVRSRSDVKDTEESAAETEVLSSNVVSTTRETVTREIRESSRTASGERMQKIGSTMKAVDIPFEDKPHTAYRPKTSESVESRQRKSEGVQTINIDLGYHTKNPRKYFGFTVGGGKDKDTPPHVESLISGTPAEEAGLKVGDVILSVSGESVEDRYHQTIMRMLREAARLGEVELQIMRPGYVSNGTIPQGESSSDARPVGLASFDEKRAKFNEKVEEQSVVHKVQEHKRRYESKWSAQKDAFEKPKYDDRLSTLERTAKKALEEEQHSPAYHPRAEGDSRLAAVPGGSTSSTRSSPISESDYRVTSFHDKPGPGKLSDFVPEVERGNSLGRTKRTYVMDEEVVDFADKVSTLRREKDIEEPKVVRNFDVAPAKSIPITVVPAKFPTEKETKHPEGHFKAQMRNQLTQEAEKDQSYWTEFPKTIEYIDAPGVDYQVINYEKETLRKAIKKSFNPTGEDKRVTFGTSEIREITPRQTQEIVFPVPTTRNEKMINVDSLAPPLPRLLSPEPFGGETKADYKPVERIHPIKLSGRPDPEGRILLSKMGSGAVPATYHYSVSMPFDQSFESRSLRSSSYDDLYSKVRKSRPETRRAESGALWNGQDGVRVIPRSSDYHVPSQVTLENSFDSDRLTRRHFSRSMSPNTLRQELRSVSAPPIREKIYAAPELVESVDSREWRQFVEEQRYPSGAPTAKSALEGDTKFRVVNSSFGNSKDISSSTSSKKSSLRHLPPVGITEATRLNKESSVASQQSATSYPLKTNSLNKNQYLSKEPELPFQQTKGRVPTPPPKQSTLLNKEAEEWNNENAKADEPVVAVSGKHRCSHCQMELGRGAAMIIESLNLFYHLSCFRCYVCNTALGNGTQGADVRVRDSKLHCQNCYCNEESGLKYSQV